MHGTYAKRLTDRRDEWAVIFAFMAGLPNPFRASDRHPV